MEYHSEQAAEPGLGQVEACLRANAGQRLDARAPGPFCGYQMELPCPFQNGAIEARRGGVDVTLYRCGAQFGLVAEVTVIVVRVSMPVNGMPVSGIDGMLGQ